MWLDIGWFVTYYRRMTSPKTRISFLALLLLTSIQIVYGQGGESLLNRCGSVEREKLKLLTDSTYISHKIKGQESIARYLQNPTLRKQRQIALESVLIPVVVHVVYNSQNIGNREGSGASTDNNIIDAQVISQIEVLNEDFSNTSGIKSFYSDSLGTDTKIRFRLVEITHNYSSINEFNTLKDANKLAEIAAPWPTDHYLNIWVCQLIPQYLGSAQFPVVNETVATTEGLELVDSMDSPDTDGVIIDYRYFGRNAAPIVSKLYNLGRTTTHEIGHWLGLIHVWGDARCGNDYCEDTPTAEKANETTNPNCIPVYSSCNLSISRNMIDNYMDYSPDQCMSLFTLNQVERMHAVLALSPRRARMVEFSNTLVDRLTVALYPNPIIENDILNIEVNTPNFQPYSIDIFNLAGILVISNLNNINRINVKNFASGIYFIRVSSGNQAITKRFAIN